MNVVAHVTYVMSLLFFVIETARRGLGYFSINATTMVEDYLGGTFLLVAAIFWFMGREESRRLMIAAWAYALGGMFVPFFAHLEAWMRGATFRPDHPHAEVGAIVMKGVLWAICLACLIVSLRSGATRGSATSRLVPTAAPTAATRLP